MAVKNESTKIVALLLDRGITVNKTDHAALIWACEGSSILVKMLLDESANKSSIQMLLKCGADINYNEGFALIEAAFQGETMIATMLVNRGVLIDSNIDKYKPCDEYTTDCRPMIIEEVENRKKSCF